MTFFSRALSWAVLDAAPRNPLRPTCSHQTPLTRYWLILIWLFAKIRANDVLWFLRVEHQTNSSPCSCTLGLKIGTLGLKIVHRKPQGVRIQQSIRISLVTNWRNCLEKFQHLLSTKSNNSKVFSLCSFMMKTLDMKTLCLVREWSFSLGFAAPQTYFFLGFDSRGTWIFLNPEGGLCWVFGGSQWRFVGHRGYIPGQTAFEHQAFRSLDGRSSQHEKQRNFS